MIVHVYTDDECLYQASLIPVHVPCLRCCPLLLYYMRVFDNNTSTGSIPNLRDAFNLRALYSASGFTTPRQIRFYHAIACSCGTNIAGTLVPTLDFCPLPGQLPNQFQVCTLMGFVVATEYAQTPSVLQPLGSLAHFLERGVRLDHQVSQHRLVGMLSTQRFTTRFVQAELYQFIESPSKPSHSSAPSGALVLNTVCCPYLHLTQIHLDVACLLITCLSVY